jgi:outer membrane protein assembly factor BamB
MRLCRAAWLLMLLAWSGSTAAQDAGTPQLSAAQIVRATGIRAGFCVHLDVSDGKLTADLAKEGKFVVHGLASTPAATEAAREHIASRDLYGAVSVEQGSLSRLPYVSNLVNLVVVQDTAAALESGISLAEVVRVLCPGGVAYFGHPGETRSQLEKSAVKGFEVLEGDATRLLIRKTRPAEMDEWTHWRHGPDGNELSSDSLAGPSARLQWVDGPFWPRDNGAARAAVFADGRGFCVMNEGQPGKPRWVLIARDAYNGLVLWKRDIASSNPRLVVAVGERVFAVLKEGGPLVALDAATGEVVRTYDVGISPFMVFYTDGYLIVGAEKEICSVDAETGAVRWRIAAPENAPFRHKDRGNQPSDSNDKLPLMISGSGRLFVFSEDAPKPPYSLVSYDLATGEERWRKKQAGELLGHYKGVLALAERKSEATWQQPGQGVLYVISAHDGRDLWNYPHPLRLQQSAILFAGGLLWITDDRSPGSSPLVGLDPVTGAEKKRVKAALRTQCSSIRATERYFIGAMSGFADGETGKGFNTPFYKAACDIGQFPANGLIYNFPHICVCYPYLRGFQAFAPAPANEPGKAVAEAADRLEKGPAYGEPPRVAADAKAEWNTWRHDPQRSGSAGEALDRDLKVLWSEAVTDCARTAYGGILTPPVVAEGMVFVAATDAHQVCALDAETGKLRWRCLLDGRVEAPPTIFGGLCLFGANNGWVYCLRAADGKMVWRFRAAPEERRIMVRGRLESPWPVPGVLVQDGVACFAAGRDSRGDDGISLHAVDPFSGKPLWEKRLRRIPWGDFFVNDVLVSNGDSISMSGWIYDPKSGERRGDLKGERFFRSGTTRSIGLMPFGFLYDRKDGAQRSRPIRVHLPVQR